MIFDIIRAAAQGSQPIFKLFAGGNLAGAIQLDRLHHLAAPGFACDALAVNERPQRGQDHNQHAKHNDPRPSEDYIEKSVHCACSFALCSYYNEFERKGKLRFIVGRIARGRREYARARQC